MSSKKKNRSNSAGGAPAPKGGRPVAGQRPTYRGNSKDLYRAGTRRSSSGGISPILGWSLAFVVIAIVVVAAAAYMSQPKGGTGGLTAPSVVTPANIASSGRTLGNPNAPITVDLYGDFRCSACYELTFGGMETNLVTDYIATGRARLVWHDRLIIDDIRGGIASRDAANAAYCAADQGKFWTMHDWLFANQASDESASAFSAARLSAIGKAAGLDMAQFQPCLDAGTHTADISSQSAADKKTITSTPTVYVDGKAVNAPGQGVSYAMIKAAIDAAPASPAP
jgi:protein-disulfide isomerase